MFLEAITLLLKHAKNSLTRIKRLFPENSPQGGVLSLLVMLEVVLEAMMSLRLSFSALLPTLVEAQAHDFLNAVEEEPIEVLLTRFIEVSLKLKGVILQSMEVISGPCSEDVRCIFQDCRIYATLGCRGKTSLVTPGNSIGRRPQTGQASLKLIVKILIDLRLHARSLICHYERSSSTDTQGIFILETSNLSVRTWRAVLVCVIVCLYTAV